MESDHPPTAVSSDSLLPDAKRRPELRVRRHSTPAPRKRIRETRRAPIRTKRYPDALDWQRRRRLSCRRQKAAPSTALTDPPDPRPSRRSGLKWPRPNPETSVGTSSDKTQPPVRKREVTLPAT